MTKADGPFASLIEHEEKIRNTYRDLLSDAVQSNIRYFLTLFLNSHNIIIGKLKSYKSGDTENAPSDVLESPTSIAATDHLETDEDVDLNSLASLLLFVAKTEADSVSEFQSHIVKTKNPEAKEYLERLKVEKEVITTQADRLYHDMIESKIS